MSKYYFNEYSLRGQFNDIEDFTDKLIEETIPVLKRIYDEEGNLIYKKYICGMQKYVMIFHCMRC